MCRYFEADDPIVGFSRIRCCVRSIVPDGPTTALADGADAHLLLDLSLPRIQGRTPNLGVRQRRQRRPAKPPETI